MIESRAANPGTEDLRVSAARANRAIGAMFFSAFGGFWFGIWAYAEYGTSVPILLGVLIVTLALLVSAYRVYKRNAVAMRALEETPEGKRTSRHFNVINAAQWISIFLVVFILPRVGLPNLVLPGIILVVGLHFLPLAWIFSYRPHYMTGAALVLLAVLYPMASEHGGTSTRGPLGAGLLLWASALWAILQKAGDDDKSSSGGTTT
jgi:hypothetical protein